MTNTKLVLGLAVFSVTSATNAATINWINDTANAGWGTVNWDLPPSVTPGVPLFDGSEDAVFNTSKITTNRTLLLNGDRYLNSIKFEAGINSRNYTIQAGSPAGKIRLKSGSLTLDTKTFTGFSTNLSAVTIAVEGGDSTSPAEWAINTSSSPTFGAIEGAAARVVRLSGATSAATTWAGNSNAFYGVIRNELGSTTSNNVRMHLNANNALGGEGSKLVLATTVSGSGLGNLYFNQTATTSSFVNTTHEMDVQFNVASALASGITNSPTTFGYSTATLNGNLSGTGNIDVGVQLGASSAMAFGRIVVAGEDNTASGNVTLRAGRLQVDGDWTGAGNFTVSRGLLAGSGSIGLASAKSVTLSSTGNYNASDPYSVTAGIAPGDIGAIGTLTIGTVGNANSVKFNSSSGQSSSNDRLTRLLVDIDGAAADRLDVIGDVTIGNTQVELVIDQLSAEATAGAYVLLSYTGTLTGTFPKVFYEGVLISDPTVPNSIAGRYHLSYGDGTNDVIALVPEPTSIAGLALIGGGLVRRRRQSH